MLDTDLCWCGSGHNYASCHKNFDLKLHSLKLKTFRGQVKPQRNLIKNEKDILGIKKAAEINTGALNAVAENICAGMDTETLNLLIHNYTIERGGTPAPLNYCGFPKSSCISINNIVCHGIPSRKTILKEGDIVNVDCTAILDGYYADASRMFMIGKVSPKAKKLVEVARECMEIGIKAVKPWGFVGDIGAAVSHHAHKHGYSVVQELGGHGVGKDFHEEPFVAHVGKQNTGMLLVPGMVLTVEPMINAGRREVTFDPIDGWTVYTNDGSLSAQWEKTILITDTGTEVLAE